MLRNEFLYRRHKFIWNLHDGLIALLKGGFVLRNGFFFRLCLVVIQNSSDASFVPPFRKFGLRCYCFLRLRRRYANSAFPVSSYAVMTNTLPGCGSGT